MRCGLATSSKLFGMVISRSTTSRSYGDTPALRGVSFDVHAGEIFGLLGPNGAGKSTLIRILMDIIRPDSGEVRVFGEPRRRAHLDRLGYLPEERGLYTKLTVTDVMTYFGALKGLSRAEARRRSSEWLERVELPHVAGWKIDRLSKGMSQKVQIASVLLADPGSACSTSRRPGSTRSMSGWCRIYCSSAGATAHDYPLDPPDESGRSALRSGGVDQSRTADGLRRGRRGAARPFAPGGPRSRAGSAPSVPAVASAIDDGEGSWRLMLADGSAPSEALATLVRAGATIDRFEPMLAPMEDIFLRVVREGQA